jgi:hypothetical protein
MDNLTMNHMRRDFGSSHTFFALGSGSGSVTTERGARTEFMYFLTYTSQTRGNDAIDLNGLIEEGRIKNSEKHITGLLLFRPRAVKYFVTRIVRYFLERDQHIFFLVHKCTVSDFLFNAHCHSRAPRK